MMDLSLRSRRSMADCLWPNRGRTCSNRWSTWSLKTLDLKTSAVYAVPWMPSLDLATGRALLRPCFLTLPGSLAAFLPSASSRPRSASSALPRPPFCTCEESSPSPLPSEDTIGEESASPLLAFGAIFLRLVAGGGMVPVQAAGRWCVVLGAADDEQKINSPGLEPKGDGAKPSVLGSCPPSLSGARTGQQRAPPPRTRHRPDATRQFHLAYGCPKRHGPCLLITLFDSKPRPIASATSTATPTPAPWHLSRPPRIGLVPVTGDRTSASILCA